MKNFNNEYNFKNPIRHFFNLNNISFDTAKSTEFKDLVWTQPSKCKIFKTENLTRTLHFPNILNFYCAIKKFETIDDFYAMKKLSLRKRVSPDLNTGEFSVMSYDKSIQNDLNNLTKYDKLLILDIKSFYGRIYTHEFGYEHDKDNDMYLEQRVSSLNCGRTNGILLGSYLSLYLAEKILIKIEEELIVELEKSRISCYFEYFSDDFYFFCNNKDIAHIKSIFSNILDQQELQLNDEKTILLDFEEYSKSNNLEKLWKKIIKQANSKDEEYRNAVEQKDKKIKYPTFLTQLVYRLSAISELKYKRVFLNNFFKTSYFQLFKENDYTLSQSDFNYLCYIYKLMPESMLYSLHKIKEMKGFDKSLFKDYINLRLKATLDTEKHEEQLYIYFAIKICGYDNILSSFKQQVLDSKNQALISYFILDKIIAKEDYSFFISKSNESEWLQNYHYVLIYDNDKLEMLIPKKATKDNQRKSYIEFYKDNVKKKIPLVKPIGKVVEAIKEYIDSRIVSYNL